MLVFCADIFLFQQSGSWLIFGLILIFKSILVMENFIFDKISLLLEFVIKLITGFEVFGIRCKQWMFGNVGKGHPLFGINDKNSLEKIFCVGCYIFYLLLFCQCVCQTEKWRTSSSNFCLHIVTWINLRNYPWKDTQQRAWNRKGRPRPKYQLKFHSMSC